MTFTTFLLTVLAVIVGNNIFVKTLVKERDSIKFWLSVFDFGFIVVDSTVEKYNYNPRKDHHGVTTIGLIETVVGRGEWHLHIGRYYVFYITP